MWYQSKVWPKKRSRPTEAPGISLFFTLLNAEQARVHDQSGQQVIVPKLYKEMEADHKVIKNELISLGIAEDEVGDIELWTKSEDFRVKMVNIRYQG